MPPVKKPKAKANVKTTVKPEKIREKTMSVVSGQLKKKLQAREKREKPKRGVVFIKHLPHGFFEDQIRRYFEQFGDVTRLRLARSKLTGGSKGFAFVEFDVPEVAEVAAETMDNYLMFNKVVKATYIPPEQQVYNFFKTSVRKVKNKAGKPIYVSYKTADINRRVKKFNEWTDEAYQKRTAMKQKKIQKLNEKYAHLGIDFNSITTGSKIGDGNTKSDGRVKNKKAESKNKSKSLEEQTSKKSKKIIALEDLLGTTLDDDSDDHDFELESGNDDSDDDDSDAETAPPSKKKRIEEVSVKNLLENTLEEDSDDSEYEVEANSETENLSDEENEDDVNSDESLDEESLKKKTAKPANKKKIKKITQPSVDRLDKLIKHKKHAGEGIKKPKNGLPKKAKFGKPKNSLQAALTKELAQPMSTLKKSSKKQGKKQKK